MEKHMLTEAQRALVEANLALIPYGIQSVGLYGLDSYEDAYQIGAIGLMNAAVHFDDTRGTTFKTFAIACIRNELRMAKRRLRWVKQHISTVSLDTLISNAQDEDFTLSETIEDDGSIEDVVTTRQLAEELCEQLKRMGSIDAAQMVHLHILKDRRQVDVADELGYTQGYVSRTIRELLGKLRNELPEDWQP